MGLTAEEIDKLEALVLADNKDWGTSPLTHEQVLALVSHVREAEHAAIDRCIALYKSRKPYDRQTVEAFEKLKEK